MHYKIQEKVERLKCDHIPENKKIEFIENLYKLANVSYELYLKESENNN